MRWNLFHTRSYRSNGDDEQHELHRESSLLEFVLCLIKNEFEIDFMELMRFMNAG